MKKWQVWMESYCGLEKHCPVRLLGEVECQTFECACHVVAGCMEAWDPEDLTVWGCKLFDNEQDARKSLYEIGK